MQCPSCGAEVQGELASICPQCFTALSQVAEPATATAAPPQPEHGTYGVCLHSTTGVPIGDLTARIRKWTGLSEREAGQLTRAAATTWVPLVRDLDLSRAEEIRGDLRKAGVEVDVLLTEEYTRRFPQGQAVFLSRARALQVTGAGERQLHEPPEMPAFLRRDPPVDGLRNALIALDPVRRRQRRPKAGWGCLPFVFIVVGLVLFVIAQLD